MNRTSQFFIYFLTLLLLVSCQEDLEPNTPTDPAVLTGDFEVKNLQIDIPEGSTFDLSGSELLSFGESFPVDLEGETKAVSTPGNPSIAILFDKADNPVLAGFVADTVSTISPQSTAIVLLSYAVGLNLREDGFLDLFINQVGGLPEVEEWQEKFTEMWKIDPLILEKGTFTNQLREVMEKLMQEPEEIDIRANAKVSDISVDDGDIKSGINIFEDGLGHFSVNNYYRRRAHAFLYKMSYKDIEDKSHQILAEISATTGSDKDFIISPTAAATSFTGVLGSAIEGKAAEVGLVKSGPIKLDLSEVESEATYKLHIIGPGRPRQSPVTDAENSQLERLEIETYVLDFVFPLMMEMYGYKEDFSKRGIEIGQGPVENLIDEFGNLLKSTPAVYDLVKSGDYLQASKLTLELLYAGALDSNFKELSGLVFDVISAAALENGMKIPAKAKATAAKAIDRAAKVLQVVNTALLGGDFVRIASGIEYSSHMEDWTIKARSAKVTLLPREATVRSRGSKEIEAEIKNLEEEGDTHLFFVWKTSGEYGFIQDTQGNKGESFESSDPKITYYSNTSASDLPEENNFEYIYVEAFLGSQSIGKDTIKLNLRKSVFEIKPNGVILSGKEGNANSVKLYLEPVNPNEESDFSDKKVVWLTEGKYGKLTDDGGFSNTITTYGKNTISYEVIDKDTKTGTELVSAQIYAKSFDGQGYFLYEELDAIININNEDDIKIKYYDLEVIKWGPTVTGAYTNCGAGTYFLIEPEPNAISYQAKVIEYGPEGLPRLTGYTSSWHATQATNEQGFYEFAYRLAGAGSSPTWIGPPACGEFIQYATARKGTAQVIIKLKNP